MSVRQRGNRWEGYVSSKNQRWRRLFATQVEAAQWEAKARLAIATGEMPDMADHERGCPKTLQALLEKTYERVWSNARSGEQLRANAQRCIDAIGPSVDPKTLRGDHIQGMVDVLYKRGISGSTINRHLAAISKMLTLAVREGWIPHKPPIYRQKEGSHRLRWLSQEEEKALLGWFTRTGEQVYHDFFLVLMDTGMRCGEALGLEAANVDLRHRQVTLWTTKNDTPRTIPLTERAYLVLASRITQANGGKLFGCTQNQVNNKWDQARAAMGLTNDPQFVPHCLRHTFCSRLVQAGVGIAEVKALAGHKTLAVTLRYAHLSPKTLRSAVDKLEAANGV